MRTHEQARGEAQQAQWEDETLPEGAKAPGLPAAQAQMNRLVPPWIEYVTLTSLGG